MELCGIIPVILTYNDEVDIQRGVSAPVRALFYCLFVKRLIFAGFPGRHYTYQRIRFEILLSLYLIEDRP